MAISIIIPSTGERVEVLIETIMAALLALKGIEGEIIVIKNKSKAIGLVHPKLKLIDVSFNNVSASRNKGAELASYELLCFIDDDMLVAADNLQRFEKVEQQTPAPYLLSAVRMLESGFLTLWTLHPGSMYAALRRVESGALVTRSFALHQCWKGYSNEAIGRFLHFENA